MSSYFSFELTPSIEIDPSVNEYINNAEGCLYGLKKKGDHYLLIAEEKTEGVWASFMRWLSSTNYNIVQIRQIVIDSEPRVLASTTLKDNLAQITQIQYSSISRLEDATKNAITNIASKVLNKKNPST